MRNKLSVLSRTWFIVLLMFLFANVVSGITLPYTFVNNSAWPDDQIYIAVGGMSKINGVDKNVWIDCKTSTVKLKQLSDNTLTLPAGKPNPGNTLYANIFCKLSEIPNKVISLPEIGSCRIWMAFKSPLYMHIFADGGSTAPDLNNETDPNIGIRFEMIELSWGLLNGSPCIWSNTTRVDSYQYPMGLELWGWYDKEKLKPYDKKVGELLHHDEIIAKWKAEAPVAYQGCLDDMGVIKFPTKIASWKKGGVYSAIMSPYIDAIWEKYRTDELAFGVQDNGEWRGRVTGDVFNFTRKLANGTIEVARINGKPSQEEILEGSGLFNDNVYPGVPDNRNLTIQTQMCAAITRHALDLTKPSGFVQDWSDDSKYYNVPLYNWYAAFWHNPAVSLDKLTYAFCYDDVFDKSSTINCPNVERATVTIGGFASSLGAHYPTTDAGVDKALVLPTNSVSLVGSGIDADGKAITYAWTKVSGGAAIIASANAATTIVTGLGIGEYVFRLTVSNGVLSTSDDISVKVDPNPNATNLALKKPITSSTINGANTAPMANDGVVGTRWESTFADVQWITVDLQSVFLINGVKIVWEAAAAKGYAIDVSLNGTSGWKSIYSTTAGDGGTDFLSSSETGRFVRLSSTSRTTGYGVSIFEFEVFGDVPSGLLTKSQDAIAIYPNPATNVLNISGVTDDCKVAIYTIQGIPVLQSVGQTVDVSSLNMGIYIVAVDNRRLVFTKR